MLWLDLETTGTVALDDDIIEVGAALTHGAGYDIVDTYQAVYRTEKRLHEIDPIVVSMHSRNGLWAEVAAAKEHAPDGQSEILDWLDALGAFGHLLPLAGSGVSHFDRRFIRQAWPALDSRLAHAMYDIGVVRRFLRQWGHLEADYGASRESSHRAMDDVHSHIEEARFFRDLLPVGSH
jgi:oligoribonuclease (3'-5' exoribonuclease)